MEEVPTGVCALLWLALYCDVLVYGSNCASSAPRFLSGDVLAVRSIQDAIDTVHAGVLSGNLHQWIRNLWSK